MPYRLLKPLKSKKPRILFKCGALSLHDFPHLLLYIFGRCILKRIPRTASGEIYPYPNLLNPTSYYEYGKTWYLKTMPALKTPKLVVSFKIRIT